MERERLAKDGVSINGKRIETVIFAQSILCRIFCDLGNGGPTDYSTTLPLVTEFICFYETIQSSDWWEFYISPCLLVGE